MAKEASVFMSANIVSRETPSQDVPSFDHRVTQCMSVVKVSAGKARNAFQSHRRKTLVPSSMVNSHRSSGTCGVGPADKTGKVAVRYCPGGSFPASALRRPEKPREMIAIPILPAERVLLYPEQINAADGGSKRNCLPINSAFKKATVAGR